MQIEFPGLAKTHRPTPQIKQCQALAAATETRAFVTINKQLIPVFRSRKLKKKRKNETETKFSPNIPSAFCSIRENSFVVIRRFVRRWHFSNLPFFRVAQTHTHTPGYIRIGNDIGRSASCANHHQFRVTKNVCARLMNGLTDHRGKNGRMQIARRFSCSPKLNQRLFVFHHKESAVHSQIFAIERKLVRVPVCIGNVVCGNFGLLEDENKLRKYFVLWQGETSDKDIIKTVDCGA